MKAQYIIEDCRKCGHKRRRLNGAWLREKRKALGLRLADVAAKLRVTGSYVCDMETGRRDVTPKLEARLLRVLKH